MDFQSSRPMVDVTDQGLTCASCNTAITQLPFQPRPGQDVYCRDCHRNQQSFRSGGGSGGSRYQGGGAQHTPRPLKDVSHLNIKCAGCGTAITQLPFDPDPSRDIYCRDCFRSNRDR